MAGLGEVLWDVYPDAAHFGGAPANFACHAASLGADSWMVSAVGVDELGELAVEKLHERGVDCGYVNRDASHATGRVLVTLNDAGQASYEFAADTAWDHLAWSDDLAVLAARAMPCASAPWPSARWFRVKRFAASSEPRHLRRSVSSM